MRRDRAIEVLRGLLVEATDERVKAGGEATTAWKAKAAGVLERALGSEDAIVVQFRGARLRYTGAQWSGMDRGIITNGRHAAIRNACGLIEAAMHQLELDLEDLDLVDSSAFDPDLWDHVKTLVEDGDWGKVASQTAIFVESHIRDWAGDPKGRDGEGLVGKALFAKVLADESDFRLGARAGEREGWRALGTGFAQALSNVDRHKIQRRADAKRYAVGMLGLGSLLLTQLRHEHSELLGEEA
jgi:hypothetical protein